MFIVYFLSIIINISLCVLLAFMFKALIPIKYTSLYESMDIWLIFYILFTIIIYSYILFLLFSLIYSGITIIYFKLGNAVLCVKNDLGITNCVNLDMNSFFQSPQKPIEIEKLTKFAVSQSLALQYNLVSETSLTQYPYDPLHIIYYIKNINPEITIYDSIQNIHQNLKTVNPRLYNQTYIPLYYDHLLTYPDAVFINKNNERSYIGYETIIDPDEIVDIKYFPNRVKYHYESKFRDNTPPLGSFEYFLKKELSKYPTLKPYEGEQWPYVYIPNPKTSKSYEDYLEYTYSDYLKKWKIEEDYNREAAKHLNSPKYDLRGHDHTIQYGCLYKESLLNNQHLNPIDLTWFNETADDQWVALTKFQVEKYVENIAHQDPLSDKMDTATAFKSMVLNEQFQYTSYRAQFEKKMIFNKHYYKYFD